MNKNISLVYSKLLLTIQSYKEKFPELCYIHKALDKIIENRANYKEKIFEALNLHLKNANEVSKAKNETNNSQNFCGRTYNESVPFNQSNFAAFQDILNKRNELLGSVKAFNQI